jgi:hypothetical protein
MGRKQLLDLWLAARQKLTVALRLEIVATMVLGMTVVSGVEQHHVEARHPVGSTIKVVYEEQHLYLIVRRIDCHVEVVCRLWQN